MQCNGRGQTRRREGREGRREEKKCGGWLPFTTQPATRYQQPSLPFASVFAPFAPSRRIRFILPGILAIMIGEAELIAWCRRAVDEFLQRHPGDGSRLRSLRALLAHPTGPLRDRKTSPGHLTASGIVFDPSDRTVLLVHHLGLNRWLQPGGHLEEGELPAQAARREVLEETGIDVGESLSSQPVDIDSHEIPRSEKKNEPAHTHHDFRFAYAMDRKKLAMMLQEAEVTDAAWIGVDDPRFPDDLRECVSRAMMAAR